MSRLGKIPVASATTGEFVATRANDGNRGGTSYWEGPFPNVTLTIPLGTNYRICSVTVQLNPDPIWGQRSQTYSIEGRDQAGGSFQHAGGFREPAVHARRASGRQRQQRHDDRARHGSAGGGRAADLHRQHRRPWRPGG